MGDVRLALCTAGEIWGGVEQCVLTLTSGLRRAGADPLVIVLCHGLLEQRLRAAGVRVEVFDAAAKYDPRQIAQLARVLGHHKINVLHVHGYKATLLGSLAARRLGIKVVKTEHGRLEPASSWSAAVEQARLRCNLALDAIASRWLIDAHVFVSRDLSRTHRERPRPVRRVIHNGIAPGGVAPNGVVPLESSTSSCVVETGSRTFDVGIVGRITRVKGHEDLLLAVERLRHLASLRVHVYGTGPLEQGCHRLAAQLDIADRVIFHGFTPRVDEQIAKLDVLVMPSWHEGLPYVLLEAMSLEVPIVATRVGGLAEVLDGQDCALLVPPRDPAALASALERLYHDAALASRLSRAARALVTGEFEATRMVTRYADLYQELLAS